MRFMMIMYPKDYANAKAGTVPDFKDMEAMGKYNEELGKAGVLVALDGLTPGAGPAFRQSNQPSGCPVLVAVCATGRGF